MNPMTYVFISIIFTETVTSGADEYGILMCILNENPKLQKLNGHPEQTPFIIIFEFLLKLGMINSFWPFPL